MAVLGLDHLVAPRVEQHPEQFHVQRMILDDQHAFGEVRRLSNDLSDRSLSPRSASVLLRPSGGTVPRTAAGTLSRCHDPDPERASGKSRRQTFSDAGGFPELMVNARIGAILG